MQRITDVVRKSSENAQESSKEASHLNSLAESLMADLNRFSIEESVALSLKKAKSAHMIFTGKIRAHLTGATRIDPNSLPTHLTCAFGQWCQGNGKDLCGHQPLFKEIEGPHAKVHELGKQAVLAYNSGDNQKAHTYCTEMISVSEYLLDMLDRMSNENASLMQWSSNFSVNIRQFDDQHKRLVEMVNQLNDAINTGKGHAVLKSIFDTLIQYTATHFAEEERLMAQHNYPDLGKHKKVHEELKKTALDLQKKFHNNSSALSTDVLKFLKDWLINHIQGLDKGYGTYLNGKGVS